MREKKNCICFQFPNVLLGKRRKYKLANHKIRIGKTIRWMKMNAWMKRSQNRTKIIRSEEKKNIVDRQ